jgi:hypothetical protein
MAGFKLWEGASLLTGEPIVVIVTMGGNNPKTDNDFRSMVQTWIMLRDTPPHEAVKSGNDEGVCGNCIQRPSVGGACYVKTFQAPLSIWRAYKRGNYNNVINLESLRGAELRLGSYGDPSAVPFDIWRNLIDKVQPRLMTGYTHQMSHKAFDKRMAEVCMISADTPKVALKAHAQGFRTFRMTTDTEQLLPNEIICPNDTDGVKCIDCGLCDGAGDKPNIAILAHGALAKRYNEKYEKINVINL